MLIKKIPFNRKFYTIKDITFPFCPMIILTAKIIKQTKSNTITKNNNKNKQIK